MTSINANHENVFDAGRGGCGQCGKNNHSKEEESGESNHVKTIVTNFATSASERPLKKLVFVRSI